MKKGLKKAWALCLCAVMILCAVPMNACAAEVGGSCGEAVTWTLNTETGTLTISGTGQVQKGKYGDPSWKSYLKSIEKVVVEDGVTRIDDGSFMDCTNLKCVTLPDSVTEIGMRAFLRCPLLTDIHLPDGMTRIEGQLFSQCTSLTEITLPDSITWIGYDAFASTGIETIVLPSGLTTIEQSTFSGCKRLTSIYIPEGVTEIGDEAFYNCIQLKNIVLPNTLERIGEYIFYNCTSLKKVVLPDSLTEIGTGAFSGCTALQSIRIPGGVRVLPYEAFYECKNLTEVTLSEGLQSIVDEAFGMCTALMQIVIPNSVKYLGAAFEDVGAVIYRGTMDTIVSNGVYVEGNLVLDAQRRVITHCSSATRGTVIIPDGVVSIWEYAFCNCSDVTAIYVPKELKYIGFYSFLRASSLKAIYYAGSEEDWKNVSDNDSGLQRREKTVYYNHVHTCDAVVTAPTYTAEGYTTYTCTECGGSYREDVVPPVKKDVPAFAVQTTKAYIGRDVTVAVDVCNNPGFVGTLLSVNYDADLLSLTGVTCGDVFDAGHMVAGDNLQAMPYKVVLLDELAKNDYTRDGTLVLFTFHVAEDAEPGEAKITLDYDARSTMDSALSEVHFEPVSESLQLAELTPGDSDGDGVLSLRDVAVTTRYLAGGWDVQADVCQADYNGDGEVTAVDVVLMRRTLAGWKSTQH